MKINRKGLPKNFNRSFAIVKSFNFLELSNGCLDWHQPTPWELPSREFKTGIQNELLATIEW